MMEHSVRCPADTVKNKNNHLKNKWLFYFSSESWTLFFTPLFCNRLIFNVLFLCFFVFFACFVPNLSRIKTSLLPRYQPNRAGIEC